MRAPSHIAVRLALVCALLLTLAGCTLSAAERHPAAKAVDGLLRVRMKRATDPTRYAPYLSSSEAATALAEDASVTASSGRPSLPGWERPYVSDVTSSGADVVVVWKRSEQLPEWPSTANVFRTEQVDGRWVVVDAQSIEASAVPDPWKP
ncbi:MAG: hypothetical protein C0418_04180 [Coriobacteriaceae bacterium]|nr:hypothetical protein [Coriobacteriaceae bacterium]